MILSKFLAFIFVTATCLQVVAQMKPDDVTPPSSPSVSSISSEPSADEPRRPMGKRIRRQVNLITGIEHDEEFLIPDRELTIGGRTGFFDIRRIKGTDYFRFYPTKQGSGITTLKDKKTEQILVEIRFNIRDDIFEKTLRELRALLGDIEGIEIKLIGNIIYIDGLILVPQDMYRISQIISAYPDITIKSFVKLNPLAWKKIAEFISNEVNNPEVKITAVGSIIKLEGQVNSQAEKDRIKQIVFLYIPDQITDKPMASEATLVSPRQNNNRFEEKVIDLITIKKDEERAEPPPKMIQVVVHFVQFTNTYDKIFDFKFSPAFSASAANGQPANSTFDSTINLISNLLPKLTWSRKHGYAKILDTASVLIQDKLDGRVFRRIVTPGPPQIITTPTGTQTNPTTVNADVTLSVKPTIKSERSGLIQLDKLSVQVSNTGEPADTTEVNTTISVRDRQSAAFGGVIKKKSKTAYGTPVTPGAIITLNASKSYERGDSQFVVFVTPIIKSSASSGVEQVKKKFGLRD